MPDKEINTGGGSAIEGDASTGGGNLTGRDNKHTTTTIHYGNAQIALVAVLIVGAVCLVLIFKAMNISTPSNSVNTTSTPTTLNVAAAAPTINETTTIAESTSTPQPTNTPNIIQSTQVITVEVTRIVEVTRLVEIAVTVESTATLPSATSTLVPSPTSSALFQDDFTDNSKSWNLGDYARLSKGKMALSVPKSELGWVTIPNLEVPKNFYIQARVQYIEGNCVGAYAGLGLGETGGNQHRFVVVGGCGSPDRIVFYDNGSEIFSSYLDRGIVNLQASVLMGLEAKDGLYTLYIDGEPAESKSLKPYGSNVGFIASSAGGSLGVGAVQFTFDDVIVRESR